MASHSDTAIECLAGRYTQKKVGSPPSSIASPAMAAVVLIPCLTVKGPVVF